MKKILFAFFTLSILMLFACKKDSTDTDTFTKLTYQDIQQMNAADFTKNNITVISGTTGEVLKPGAIILFKSTDGYYGKMKVVSNGSDNAQYSLIFDLVIYAFDGSGAILLEEKDSVIEVGEYYKLSIGSVSQTLNVIDFSWSIDQQSNMIIKPLNNATFFVYPIE